MVAELTRYCTGVRFYASGTVCRLAFLLLLVGASWPVAAQWTLEERAQRPLGQSPDTWVPLANDKVHDPRGPSLRELQNPGDGLYQLPAVQSGNRVRWAMARDRGAINPRRSLKPDDPETHVFDMDLLLSLNGSFPIVRFSHKLHTQWLGCDNCHDQIFKPQLGASGISMYAILQGEQCGLCHGSVAFPVTECAYCHNVERSEGNAWRLKRLEK